MIFGHYFADIQHLNTNVGSSLRNQKRLALQIHTMLKYKWSSILYIKLSSSLKMPQMCQTYKTESQQPYK